eukprot:3362159-Rhodomonas_salina.2
MFQTLRLLVATIRSLVQCRVSEVPSHGIPPEPDPEAAFRFELDPSPPPGAPLAVAAPPTHSGGPPPW